MRRVHGPEVVDEDIEDGKEKDEESTGPLCLEAGHDHSACGEAEVEDEFDDDDIEDMLAGRSGDKDKASPSREGGKGAVGILEKKANITKIGGEVIIGRDGSGPVKVSDRDYNSSPMLIVLATFHVVQFNVLVTYTYRADDPPEEAPSPASHRQAAPASSTKSFSFYVCIDLGIIAAQM